jgi:hypothetical protein
MHAVSGAVRFPTRRFDKHRCNGHLGLTFNCSQSAFCLRIATVGSLASQATANRRSATSDLVDRRVEKWRSLGQRFCDRRLTHELELPSGVADLTYLGPAR